MTAATICRTCKHRPAQEGGCGVPLCSSCRVEADAFMARFTQNDSIEDRADWIAIGLIGSGLLVVAGIAIVRLVGGWPL